MSYIEPEEYEPKEHDELAAKVYVMIQDEVKAKMQSTIEGLEYQTKHNSELRSQIRELNRTIRANEEETKKQLREKEKDVRRDLFGGFMIGDTVYYPSGQYNSKPCETCEKKGKVSLALGESDYLVNCPKCKGYGKISFTTFSPKEDKIRSIHLELHEERKLLHFYLAREDRKREHDKVFKTLEECQTLCDLKNGIETTEIA